MNQFYLPLIFCFFAFMIFGQFGKAKVISGCETCLISSISINDFDLVVASEKIIAWYKNKGNGNFSSPSIIKNSFYKINIYQPSSKHYFQ